MTGLDTSDQFAVVDVALRSVLDGAYAELLNALDAADAPWTSGRTLSGG